MIKKGKLAAVISVFFSFNAFGSPWLEANDALLRAHLQTLVDAQLLSSSANTFPMRWTQISEELTSIDASTLSPLLQLSFRYVKHSYDSQRVGRALRGGQLVWNSEQTASHGFSDTSSQYEWNTSFLSESSGQYHAYRINANYGKEWQESDNEFHLTGSYVALGDGVWQITLDQLERWWGNGWANSLSWSQKGQPLENINIGHIIDTPYTKDIWVETNLSKLNQPIGAKYLWSSRLSGRAWLLDYGISTQYAFDGDKALQNTTTSSNGVFFNKDLRNTFDIRASIPFSNGVSSSIYGLYSHHISETDADNEVVMFGADAQWMMLNTALRMYIETLEWKRDERADLTHLTTAPDPDNTSFGVIASLPNDHTIRLGYRDFTHGTDDESLKSIYSSYSLYAFSGITEIGLAYEDTEKKSEYSFNLGWTFRF